MLPLKVLLPLNVAAPLRGNPQRGPKLPPLHSLLPPNFPPPLFLKHNGRVAYFQKLLPGGVPSERGLNTDCSVSLPDEARVGPREHTAHGGLHADDEAENTSVVAPGLVHAHVLLNDDGSICHGIQTHLV